MSKKTKNTPLPPLAYLEQFLTYNAHTGSFYWLAKPEELFKATPTHSAERKCKTWNTKYAGTKAGYVRQDGYVYIGIDGKFYLGHRLAYFMGTGEDPLALTVDHVDPRNKSDNRISNLRLATLAEQSRNMPERSDNTSGITGVRWKKQANKWQSRITVGGKLVHIGYFTDFDEAVRARKAAERELGFSENHGLKGEESS